MSSKDKRQSSQNKIQLAVQRASRKLPSKGKSKSSKNKAQDYCKWISATMNRNEILTLLAITNPKEDFTQVSTPEICQNLIFHRRLILEELQKVLPVLFHGFAEFAMSEKQEKLKLLMVLIKVLGGPTNNDFYANESMQNLYVLAEKLVQQQLVSLPAKSWFQTVISGIKSLASGMYQSLFGGQSPLVKMSVIIGTFWLLNQTQSSYFAVKTIEAEAEKLRAQADLAEKESWSYGFRTSINQLGVTFCTCIVGGIGGLVHSIVHTTVGGFLRDGWKSFVGELGSAALYVLTGASFTVIGIGLAVTSVLVGAGYLLSKTFQAASTPSGQMVAQAGMTYLAASTGVAPAKVAATLATQAAQNALAAKMVTPMTPQQAQAVKPAINTIVKKLSATAKPKPKSPRKSPPKLLMPPKPKSPRKSPQKLLMPPKPSKQKLLMPPKPSKASKPKKVAPTSPAKKPVKKVVEESSSSDDDSEEDDDEDDGDEDEDESESSDSD
jgi:hypothetical protein